MQPPRVYLHKLVHFLGKERLQAEEGTATVASGPSTRGHPILIVTPAAPLPSVPYARVHVHVENPEPRPARSLTAGDRIPVPQLRSPDLPHRAGPPHGNPARPPGTRRPPPPPRRRMLGGLPPRVAPRAGGAADPAAGDRRPRPPTARRGAPGRPAPGEWPDVDVQLRSAGPGFPLLPPLLLLRRLLLPDPKDVLPPLRPRRGGAGDGSRDVRGGRRPRRGRIRRRLRLRLTSRRGIRLSVRLAEGEEVEGEEDAVSEELVGREELLRGLSDSPELELRRRGGAAAPPRASIRGSIHRNTHAETLTEGGREEAKKAGKDLFWVGREKNMKKRPFYLL
ncbi:unnamed protein product [Musa acuminata subsp. burmannicoides]